MVYYILDFVNVLSWNVTEDHLLTFFINGPLIVMLSMK